MRSYIVAGAVIAARLAAVSAVTTDSTGGNSYCDAKQAIALTNFGQPGSYQDVVDLTNGCNMIPKSYGGGISPHDEQTSFHFRGPLKLKQFAVYFPGSSSKEKREETLKNSRHGHVHFHKREAELREELQKREAAAEAGAAMGDMVTAMINGAAATFACNWAGCGNGAAAAPTPAPPAAHAAAMDPPSSSTSAPATTAPPASSSSPPKSQPSSPSSPPSSGGGSGSDWSQAAYYSAEKQIAKGLVFLAENTWSTAKLGYTDSSGCGKADSPQVLGDIQIPNNKQFMIFSDTKCSGPGKECGFYNGDVAYHGFDGPKKAFFFEFQMPTDMTPADQNVDMPSLWALNAKIPRLGQYSPCSCWLTGCGEIDLFEVLAPGSDKCVQAVHAVKGENKNSGTPCDYFKRPVDKTIKAATIFDVDSGSVTTVILPDNTNFDAGFSSKQMTDFIKNAGSKAKFAMLD